MNSDRRFEFDERSEVGEEGADFDSDYDFLGFKKAMSLQDEWDKLQKVWEETEEVPYEQKDEYLIGFSKIVINLIENRLEKEPDEAKAWFFIRLDDYVTDKIAELANEE